VSSPEESIEIMAHQAWGKGERKRAFDLFAEGAAMGQVGCMLALGYFYDEGIGIRKNKGQAMLWYKRAYRNGSSAAASNIATLYGEQHRDRLAFQWFRRAAQLGDGDANVDLAKCCLQGKGVRRSIPSAKRYLRAALSSTFVTEAGRDEAAALVRGVGRDR
jgi:TPR repeat protein